jgi:hypothetical protein
VVSWSVRKVDWIIRESCSKGGEDAQGHLDPSKVVNPMFEKSCCLFWVLARQREAVKMIARGSGWERSFGATLGLLERSRQGTSGSV